MAKRRLRRRPDQVGDWYVELVPIHPNAEGGKLEVLSGDEQDAIEALEAWAAAINSHWHVPDGLDWRNRSGANVGKRIGRRSFAVRVDSFEVETETGYTSGAGRLIVREAWSDAELGISDVEPYSGGG